MNRCPLCGSLNIRDRAVTEEDLPASRFYACNGCGRRFEADPPGP